MVPSQGELALLTTGLIRNNDSRCSFGWEFRQNSHGTLSLWHNPKGFERERPKTVNLSSSPILGFSKETQEKINSIVVFICIYINVILYVLQFSGNKLNQHHFHTLEWVTEFQTDFTSKTSDFEQITYLSWVTAFLSLKEDSDTDL